jgi:hypothetical protein
VPSSLNEIERSTIALTHPEIGAWRYEVEGRGELPGVMPEHRPEATVGEATSYMFTFRNPFKRVMSIDVVLNSGDDAPPDGARPPTIDRAGLARSADGLLCWCQPGEAAAAGDRRRTFTLLMKKASDLPINPFGVIQIPISFTPFTIEEKRATVRRRGCAAAVYAQSPSLQVEVRGSMSGHSLCWVFPLRGAVNAPQYPRSFTFKCKAKAAAREVVELPLRALAGLKGPETFTHELVVPDAMRSLVEQSLQVLLLPRATAANLDARVGSHR